MHYGDSVNLDNEADLQCLNPGHMLETVMSFPHQMKDAQSLGDRLPLNFTFHGSEIVICGMGGSAIGGDMLRYLLAPQADVAVLTNRSYDLPAFVDEDSLVIAISYSGNTEETLSCFDQAVERNCTTITVSSGGALDERVDQADLAINIPIGLQPRAALAYLCIPIARVLERLNVAPSLHIPAAIQTVSDLQSTIMPSIPTASNRAKQMALALRAPVLIYGFDLMAVAATRWRHQLNENTKMAAFDFDLPEANHNELMAWECMPPEHPTCIFLCSPRDSPQITKRYHFMKGVYESVAQVLEVHTDGAYPLAQLMSAVHLGDMVSVYCALAHDIDPTPVNLIAKLKGTLATIGKK